MKRFSILAVILALVGLACLGATPGKVLADGTETLGPPSIPIASGSGIVAAGTGLFLQLEGTIDVEVPIGATVNQVLLYWNGVSEAPNDGDDTIIVDGSPVTGTLIGGPLTGSSGGTTFLTSPYRADITGLGLIDPGSNTLTVSGLDDYTGGVAWGAGVLVIFDDGSNAAEIDIRDGADSAFCTATTDEGKFSVPQTFTFTSASVPRTATLSMFFSSVQGEGSAGAQRPNDILITVGAVTTTLNDLLNSNDGDEWDTLNLPVTIPAGADSLTVEAVSPDILDPLCASFDWLTAGLSVPGEPCIDLIKEVRVDGTWFDANSPDCADGPTTSDPAEYRLTITNCGGEVLVDVVIDDDVLGIGNVLVGNIPVDGSIILTSDDIPALGIADLCPLTPGDPGVEDSFLRNIARVDANGETSGIPVFDEDPACVKCEEEEGCLTLTPGFWCTHDRVTELFLPVFSCGIPLDNIDPATPGSAIEDLDFSGRDFQANDTSPQQLQLIRQCTAAALNFAASAQAGGSCSGIVLSDGRTIDEVFAACCEDLCTSGASGPTISESNCIERLDEFNNLEPDTLTCETDPQAPFPFCPSLGANGFNATPETCQVANGNGFVNPDRNLGPKNGGGPNG